MLAFCMRGNSMTYSLIRTSCRSDMTRKKLLNIVPTPAESGKNRESSLRSIIFLPVSFSFVCIPRPKPGLSR
ncbi:hypothetical protein ARMSODRAFT_302666 [Armillaria solidipes]|uniref:Uncharacterized protein n=1 Tax=Armillaria solidipes TaxID=1076256 RepID=A0A2H3BV90_9AGAR|nr:hypothetical protein ARMSODRAFT_302666 [Armillaria solidipes]